MTDLYDVIIIGAGVTGSSCARELSRYDLKIAVLERCEDVCCGTSKANSGIVHSGIDCKTGTLMQEMNIKGNAMMEQLSRDLDFDFKRNGSLIVCFSEEDMPRLEALYNQGVANGVTGLTILNKSDIHQMEPNLSDDVYAGIFAPTGGIVCPFGMNIAMAENAAFNGVEFHFNTEVTDISYETNAAGDIKGLADKRIYTVTAGSKSFKTKCIVNAAGVYADLFHNMVSASKIHITPRRGEYCLLDKTAGNTVQKTIFQLPGKYGKGVLVTPTVHGNLLLGPTADDYEDKDETCTTSGGIAKLLAESGKAVSNIPIRQVITSFAGNRAHEDGHEFIIGEVSDAPGFVDVAGIESPGLTSAPAIGVRVSEIVAGILKPEVNYAFIGIRNGIINPKKLSQEDYAKLIEAKPEYGNIICRCESITEGEIIDAIHRPLGARSLDGVKRRTRAGMGRCQAGFCSPKTMEIISRELKCSPLEITKSGGDSKIVVGLSKGGEA